MKKILLSVLLVSLLFCLVVFLNISSANSHKVAILGYHSIMPREQNKSGDNLIVDQEKFAKELEILKFFNYKTLTLDEFYCWKNKKCKQPKKSVLITFDDGYKNNYEYAYKLLKENKFKATTFFVGSYIEANDKIHTNKETLEKIKEEYPNIEIASHSYNLHYHSNKKYEEVKNDINRMNKIVKTKYYAYPFGDYNKEYVKALKDNGYKMAFTFGPKKIHRKADYRDNNYLIPRLNISNDMSLFKFVLRLLLPI